jgi:hypothetical protein
MLTDSEREIFKPKPGESWYRLRMDLAGRLSRERGIRNFRDSAYNLLDELGFSQ